MKVRLLHFAVLRDIAGRDDEQLDLVEGTTPRQVWETMRCTYARLGEYLEPPLAAINESYASPDTALRDGDELAFIPPVAGG